MKQGILFCFLAFVILFTACKKNSEGLGNVQSEPVITARGEVVGTPDVQTIGSAGGTLLSSDGRIMLTVPQGAVSENTVFTIQPITNMLYEGSSSKPAYRLLPEGITFSKPVELTFVYDDEDLKTTVEDAMTVAWQQPDGTWKVEPSRLDKQMRTLTVETTHFSDWLKTGGFELRIEKAVLKTREKSKLWIVSIGDDELLTQLGVTSEDNANLTRLGNWKIIKGEGSLEEHKGGPKGFGYSATYTAPSQVDGVMNVSITVEAEGFSKVKDPSAPGGIRKMVKIILIGQLFVGDNFMTGELDGVPFGFFGDKVVATGVGGVIMIRASDGSGEVTINANGTTAGSYSCGQITFPGKAGILVNTVGGPMYAHSYIECGDWGEIKFSPASLQITKWPEIGGAAEGNFSGLVYLADGLCGVRQKMLSVQFNVTRTN